MIEFKNSLSTRAKNVIDDILMEGFIFYEHEKHIEITRKPFADCNIADAFEGVHINYLRYSFDGCGQKTAEEIYNVLAKNGVILGK
jgi:hypothetical protein